MMRSALLCLATLPIIAQTESPAARTLFRVKQVAAGVVYIDGGTADGLQEGMRLELVRRPPGAALIEVRRIGTAVILALATQSAVCELRDLQLDAQPGDEARLSPQDAEARQRAEIASGRRRYAQVITFAGGDPMEEEVRQYTPHPPLEEEGKFRGRIGFEYSSLSDHTAPGVSSYQSGGIIRADWTRINHSYWTLSGYWRGRLDHRRAGRPDTLTDLTNRTYHLSLVYSNPQSRNEFGFGRLLLPWASSLSTIDGGYAARRLTKSATAGIFAGSTPDPAQWNYAPNRQLVGAFISAQAGSFESARWTGTAGLALTRLRWRPERQFVFFENSLFFGQKLSIFHNAEADQRNPRLMNGARGAQLSRSFLTVRVQPHARVSFDANHNYFQGVPTFDSRLIGLGFVDKLLFTGFSGGMRIEPVNRLILSTDLGRSSREGDAKRSLNQAYGAAYTRLPWIGARIDARVLRYDSSFGRGRYETLTLTKEFWDGVRLDLQAGQQDTRSQLSGQTRARFAGAQFDVLLKGSYFLNGGVTFYRGRTQNYDQIYISVGYRFQ